MGMLSLHVFLLLSLLVTTTIASEETLQEAIIKDMMPGTSPMCISHPGETESDFTFSSSQNSSHWYSAYSDVEQYLFAAKMSHVDDHNANQTWTIRLGKAGNIYSFVGPMGETVPPQARRQGPWVDEVWQTVSVDVEQKKKYNRFYFIHEAGSYQTDLYNSSLGIPLTNIPFFSPSLGRFCNDHDGECGFASWGQHGHVPTNFTSDVLYFNRYKDCGNGVLEHTIIIHSNVGNNSTINHVNVPWGGVRQTTLNDVVVTSVDKGHDQLVPVKPLPKWREGFLKTVDDTLGYTIFAENLPFFQLPCEEEDDDDDNDDDKNKNKKNNNNSKICLSLTIGTTGCNESPTHTTRLGRLVVRCELEPTAMIETGTSTPVKFTAIPPQPKEFVPPCNSYGDCLVLEIAETCEENIRLSQVLGKYTVHCALTRTVDISMGEVAAVKFQTSTGGGEIIATKGVHHWARRGRFLFFFPDVSVVEVNKLFVPGTTLQVHYVPSGGGEVMASQGVHHWAWNGNIMYFSPDCTAFEVRRKFPPGSRLVVSSCDGKSEEENFALAHVYGTNNTYHGGYNNQNNSGIATRKSRLVMGTAPPGRDFLVYTINAFPLIHGGDTYFYRQYFMMGRYKDVASLATVWVNETLQGLYPVQEPPSNHNNTGRSIVLYATKDGEFDARLHGICNNNFFLTPVCIGSTTPKPNFKALFQIQCGTSNYVGSDPYYFAPPGNPRRPYVCEGMSTERAEWTLLGFFEENICAPIVNFRYNDQLCG